MLSLKQRSRNNKSRKRFLQMENEVLLYLVRNKILTGSYGAAFNELSYRLSNVVEIMSLRHVNDEKEAELVRIFSPNPDIFHFASSKGMKTSTYLAYEGKSDEAKERILGKIEAFFKEEISKNPYIPQVFSLVNKPIYEILTLRYPDVFPSGKEETQSEIDALLKGE